MRLSAIKLAGFKSFVDPTQLRLSSVLAGVVGPNGCGKSNVIDAVRWVMGESSARQLRGEALEDVIFNGAKTRKPVGRASVELTFDNHDASLGGRYAGFGEIAIRREITREGGSQYFLNGARCRRRDVIDIFLGTGLGTRSSYAIIEQGTVSRIIEARPDDMRLLLEEAAGISKYKDKRRETENRIRHTRENLDRLNDLRSELASQLEKLERQARNAEKYKQYKADERQLKAELIALKYQAMAREAADREVQLQSAEQRCSHAETGVHEAAHTTELARQAEQEAIKMVQASQADFYTAEAAVAQVEQTLRHAREMAEMRQQEKNALEGQLKETMRRQAEETDRHTQLHAELQTLAKRLSDSEMDNERLQSEAEASQGEVDAREAKWEQFNREAQSPLRALEVERARASELTRRLQITEDRRQRLESELTGMDTDAMQAELDELDTAIAAKERQCDALKAESEAAAESVSARQEKRAEMEQQLHDARTKLQDGRGRLASLEALQTAALGRDDSELGEWLSARGWDERKRLAEHLTATPGWEMAIESVLAHLLDAVCLEDPIGAAREIGEWPSPGVTLVSTSPSQQTPRELDLTPLANEVEGPLPQALTGLVFLADSDERALNAAGQLAPAEIAVSRSGLMVGADWLKYPGRNSDDAGMLARQRSLAELRHEVEENTSKVNSINDEVQSVREAIGELEKTLNHVRRDHQQFAETLNRDRNTREAKAVRLEQARARAQRLLSEIGELRDQAHRDTEQLSDAKTKFEANEQHARELGAQREQLQANVKQARQHAAEKRKNLEQVREVTQRLQVDVATRRSSLESAQRALGDYAERASTLEAQVAKARAALEQAAEPITASEDSREAAIATRARAQQALDAARAQQAAADKAMGESDRNLRAAEAELDAAREVMQSLRLEGETRQVRLQTLAEQVAETGFQMDVLLEGLDENANVMSWEEKIQAMDRRIQRLGPINLAAIEEYEEQSRRAEYLNAQDEDLREALTTLENAINRIDRETRSRFRETFERVDAGFRVLFPKLFGGGEAYLEVTGDDLLEAGVRVMGRPPGKRNSSIQLLSGGEKALTAVALVFSLFQLNPAPFCMLDEVDAPLDDANVGRFCNLVREMSATVQFVVITHNKLTMELADQLHGVTMQEPGVSRLVSVDVEHALEMAAS